MRKIEFNENIDDEKIYKILGLRKLKKPFSSNYLRFKTDFHYNVSSLREKKLSDEAIMFLRNFSFFYQNMSGTYSLLSKFKSYEDSVLIRCNTCGKVYLCDPRYLPICCGVKDETLIGSKYWNKFKNRINKLQYLCSSLKSDLEIIETDNHKYFLVNDSKNNCKKNFNRV